MTILTGGPHQRPGADQKKYDLAIAFDDALPLDETGDTSEAIDLTGQETITFFFENTSDKSVEYDITAGPDADTPAGLRYTIGTTTTLTDGSVTPTKDKVHLTVADHYPYYWVTMKTAAAQGATTVGEARTKIRSIG